MWSLLRFWHVESLDTVIEHPRGISFTRTSYIAAPSRWRELPIPELVSRLEQLLIAAYNRRNYTLRDTDDPARMVPFVFDFEWVEHDDAPAMLGAVPEPWVLPNANAHPDLVMRGLSEIDARRRVTRPGLHARPYANAFEAIRIDEDDSWHLVRSADRAAMFASRFG